MTIEPSMISIREPLVPLPAVRRGLPRAYVGVWLVLGAISATYLAKVGVRGADLASLRGPGTAVASDDAAIKRDEESRKARASLAEFQSDVGRLRLDLERRGLDSDVIGSLSALEERASIETGIPVAKVVAAAPQAIPAQAIAAPPETATPAPAAATYSASAQPLAAQTQAQAQILAAPLNTAAIETGSLAGSPTARPAAADAVAPVAGTSVSMPLVRAEADADAAPAAPPAPATAKVAAAPISFGPAVVKPAPKPFAVQLASGASLDAIRLSWSLLSDKHGDALKNLRPQYTATETQDAGEVFDLIAGPVKSAVDARKICKTLAARGIDCKVSPFAGAAL